jgi:hypothetical protein
VCADRTDRVGTKSAVTHSMTRFFQIKFLAVALLAAPTLALADEATDRAVVRERSDAARVDYYAKMAVIAERDLDTAKKVLEMARTQRAIAVRERDSKGAAYWSKRQEQALAEARTAREESARYRQARDAARADLEASSDAVRKLRRPG